ncbi:hypothetical protein, partial [Methanothrix sp.]|uniref:hypothetical protein n=1 Tax=Methanothrix sp. TaxID=90426 RepID=UPI003BB6F7B1
PYWFPRIPMIKGKETCIKRNLEAQGIKLVCDLFTKRNLWALALIRDNIESLESERSVKDSLFFALEGILLT